MKHVLTFFATIIDCFLPVKMISDFRVTNFDLGLSVPIVTELINDCRRPKFVLWVLPYPWVMADARLQYELCKLLSIRQT